MNEVSSAADDEGRLELHYRSKTDLVADYLRKELQAGRPAAGERLVVSRMADKLGVSKVPVREAVTRLIGEGVLTLKPNVGPVVPEFTAHEVIETAMMRVALERLALETAVTRHTPESLHSIEAILAQMAKADTEFPALNVRFHLAMIDASPYRELVRTAGSLLDRAQRYRTARLVPGYRLDAHSEHIALFEHLRDGDVPALQELNERHIMDAAHKLTAHMAES